MLLHPGMLQKDWVMVMQSWRLRKVGSKWPLGGVGTDTATKKTQYRLPGGVGQTEEVHDHSSATITTGQGYHKNSCLACEMNEHNMEVAWRGGGREKREEK